MVYVYEGNYSHSDNDVNKDGGGEGLISQLATEGSLVLYDNAPPSTATAESDDDSYTRLIISRLPFIDHGSFESTVHYTAAIESRSFARSEN